MRSCRVPSLTSGACNHLTTTNTHKTSASGSGLLGRVFLVLCIVHFLSSFTTSPVASLFPVYVEADLSRSPQFTGGLLALLCLFGGVFAVIAGSLCDVLGRKAVLLVGLAGSMLAGMAFRVADPLMLASLLLVVGAGFGSWATASQSYLITSVDTRRLGLGGAIFFLSKTAGDSLGNLAAGIFKESWTFAQLGLAMIAAASVVFVLALVLLPDGKRSASHQVDRPRLALWSAYRPLLTSRGVRLLVSLRYMVTTFWGMAALLMPLLLYRVSGSESMAAYYAFVSLAVAGVCQLLTGVLCDRFGRLWPLLVAAGGIVVSAVCVAMFWQSLACLFAFGTALTATAWGVSTLIPKLINDVAAADQKSRLVGLCHMTWSAAMVTGSLLGGLLVEIDPSVPFFTGAALCTAGALCAWRLCIHLDRQGK